MLLVSDRTSHLLFVAFAGDGVVDVAAVVVGVVVRCAVVGVAVVVVVGGGFVDVAVAVGW